MTDADTMLLKWLRSGSDDHDARLSSGRAFSIVPKPGRVEAFQVIAKRAIRGAGRTYSVKTHTDSDSAFGGFDLVLVAPFESAPD